MCCGPTNKLLPAAPAKQLLELVENWSGTSRETFGNGRRVLADWSELVSDWLGHVVSLSMVR